MLTTELFIAIFYVKRIFCSHYANSACRSIPVCEVEHLFDFFIIEFLTGKYDILGLIS